jgi:hypothetical protein
MTLKDYIPHACRVLLNDLDMKQAHDIARKRMDWAKLHNAKTSLQKPADEFEEYDMHLCGTCADIAVAKFLKLNWAPKFNRWLAPDLPQGIYAKWSHDWSHLYIPLRTKHDSRHALVYGIPPEMFIVGWITKQDAYKVGWISDVGQYHRRCIIVWPPHLKPIWSMEVTP